MNLLYPPIHYYQNQGMVPDTGPVECVTTSVVMAMNMAKDRLARDFNQPPIPDISVQEYAAGLDGKKIFGLPYRIPSDFFLAAARGWIHPVFQAPAALRQFAQELKQKYNYPHSFAVKQSSGNTLENIRENLQAGNFVLIHGLWAVSGRNDPLYRFGGHPHTMLPVDVDDRAGKVILLNPAEPDPRKVKPGNPSTYPTLTLDQMPMQEFLAFWGRKSILNLYTRPFTMTVVIPEPPPVA
jgi:hypothetical protein